MTVHSSVRSPPTVYHLADEPTPVPDDPRWQLGHVLVAGWVARSARCWWVDLASATPTVGASMRGAEPIHDERFLSALAAARSALGLQCEPSLRGSVEVPAPGRLGLGAKARGADPAEALDRGDGINWTAVFIHELAHLRRKDHWTSLFADEVAAVLFWNVRSMWVARRQLAWTSEFACDDSVVVAGRSPVELAHALLALRRRRCCRESLRFRSSVGVPI